MTQKGTEGTDRVLGEPFLYSEFLGLFFCAIWQAFLKNRRTSRGFSEVGKIAPQAPFDIA